MNIKKMVERQNELRETMTGIVDIAEAEGRELTPEEITKFDDCKTKISDIENTIVRAEEVNNMHMVKTPTPGAVNEREAFANTIRGIYNGTTSDASGVTIPTTIGEEILKKVSDICPIFEMATRYNVTGKLVLVKENGSDLAMAYVTEGTAASETGITFAENLELAGFLASVLAKIPNSLIVNSKFDIVSYVVNRIAEEIAAFLEKELLTGKTKAKGLEAGVTQTVTAAKATAVTADELIDLQAMVPDAFQTGAVWFMNGKTRAAIRKLKDGQGNYLMVPDFSAQSGYSILGHPVYCSDNIPEMGAKATAVYYGDMSGLAVKISEDIEIKILSEAYATEHMTGIVAFVEFDSGVQNPQKIAALKMATA